MSNELDQILALSNPLATLNSFFTQLHPASWNGVPFFIDGNETEIGRRNAEHVYPFRDTPWMEDIGRRGRRYEVVGFLVGDDVISQRDNMQVAAENPGPGTLVHPTYGTLIVSCCECRFRENKSHGRMIEVHFRFMESGVKLYPSQGISTGANVTNNASAANQAISDDFGTQMISSLQNGASVAAQALRTASQWVGEATQLGNDSTNIFHLASDLNGSFGRFYGGATGAGNGSIIGSYVSPSQLASQVSNLINVGVQDRANIAGAASKALSAAGGL